MASKKNLVKGQFPYIDMFDHERPLVINAIRDLTIGLFDHLEIILPANVDKRLAYTYRILRVSVLKIQINPGNVQAVGKGDSG